tara:strand:+ start:559 stop:819 length:261 start_codon:yes stop_codon:yes gene_type:complete
MKCANHNTNNPLNSFCSLGSLPPCFIKNAATFIDAGPEAEILREIHSQNNPNQSAFIHGDKVGVLVVNVVEARICDASDKVLAWRL